MLPTPYAIALAQRARAIHQESERARLELSQLRDGGVGSIKIGTGPLWSVHVLPQVIADLVETYPQLRVRLVPGVLDTLLPQLIKGELDIVCSALDFPDQVDLQKEHLIESEHIILVHETHQLGKSRKVTPEALSRCAFVGMHNDYAVLDRMTRYFALRGQKSPGFAAEVGSLEMLFSLVATGAFVATQSNQVLERAAQMGIRKMKVEGSFWKFEGGVVFRESSASAPLVTLFRDALKARLAELGESVFVHR